MRRCLLPSQLVQMDSLTVCRVRKVKAGWGCTPLYLTRKPSVCVSHLCMPPRLAWGRTTGSPIFEIRVVLLDGKV